MDRFCIQVPKRQKAIELDADKPKQVQYLSACSQLSHPVIQQEPMRYHGAARIFSSKVVQLVEFGSRHEEYYLTVKKFNSLRHSFVRSILTHSSFLSRVIHSNNKFDRLLLSECLVPQLLLTTKIVTNENLITAYYACFFVTSFHKKLYVISFVICTFYAS